MLNARRAALAAAAVLTSLAASAAPASAGIWTPVDSGTTSDITAVADLAPDTLVYGTASGQLLKNGTVRATNPGFSIISLAFSPSGSVGLATATNGRLLRSTNHGDSWSVVSLANTSVNQTLPCSSVPSGAYTPTGNLTGAAWSSNTTAYVTATDRGVVLKSTNGGANWNDASRQADGSCFVDTNGDVVTDVAAIPGSGVVWFADDGFGATSLTTDGLTSAAPRRTASDSVNCFDHRPRLAVDLMNTNRAFMVDTCSGKLQLGSTTDGGTTWNMSLRYFAGDGDTLTGLNDVAIAGGNAMAVGNGGAILIAPNSTDAYFQRADGALATTDWLAVSKREGARAVVGGAGGALIQTDTAARIPDLVAPGGTVIGPATATVGVPVTLTLVAGDNTGGSGLDPAGTVWTAPGLPATPGSPIGTGNVASFTFPAAGFYAITVTYKDLAGNVATSGFSVSVKDASTTPTTPTKTETKSKINTTTATVPGAKISFGVPSTCVKAGSTFKVTLTWKKQKRKGNKFVKVRRADFFIGAKRVKIDKQAPFTQTLKVTATAKKGSTITVKARAYIKVTKGKSPTKSIASKIKVCG
jgi:hypothetical protein